MKKDDFCFASTTLLPLAVPLRLIAVQTLALPGFDSSLKPNHFLQNTLTLLPCKLPPLLLLLLLLFHPRTPLTPLTLSQPHYLPSPPSLQISSQATRTAGNNMTQALSLIHGAIASAAQSVIVGETSDAQKDKVRRLARAEDGRRREMKDKRSSKKAARRDW